MTGDLPSGEIPGSQAAEVPEDFPSGKRSRTAAKEEDVDIQNAEEQQEEIRQEIPQGEPTNEVYYDPEGKQEESESESMKSTGMNKANELVNSDMRISCRRRIHVGTKATWATYQQAVKDEPFLQPEEQEEKMYQEQLEQRKQPDIFAQPSSSDFLILLQPESEDPMSSGQVKVEKLCWSGERKGRFQTCPEQDAY